MKLSGFLSSQKRADFEKSHQAHDSFTKSGNSAGKGLFNPNQTKIDFFDETELPKHDKENKFKLSKKGLELINL